MPKLSKRVGVRKDFLKEFNMMQYDIAGKPTKGKSAKYYKYYSDILSGSKKSREKKLEAFKSLSPADQKTQLYKAYYKKLAKAADARLLKLERLSKQKGYASVLQYAYRVAMYDLKGMFGEGTKRFNKALPDDLRTVHKDIRNVLRFLDLPTSTKSGIDETYNKRAQTLNARYGTNVDWKTIANLFQSSLYKKLDAKYASKTAVRAIGILQQKEKDIVKALERGDTISITVPDEPDKDTVKRDKKKKKTTIESTKLGTKLDEDGKLEDAINNILRYRKKDLKNLLKGI